jgi:hypothetical protein
MKKQHYSGLALTPENNVSVLADRLWRVNSEYLKRLSQAQKYMLLLEQLYMQVYESGDGQESTLYALQAFNYLLQQIDYVSQEHRSWRYTYYYQSSDNKRMVQMPRSVGKALAKFDRMLASHQAYLREMQGILYELPRPNPDLTRVPSGDLWEMALYAVDDLASFADSLHTDTVAK